MPQLVIVRGLPGSGKSTYAKTLNMVHFEADRFFEKDGVYNFDAKLLAAAHRWCFNNVIETLKSGHDCVVSNTFTKIWEMGNYVTTAKILGDVKIRVVEMHTQYDNVHNVPVDIQKQMAERWQPIPSHWLDEGIEVEIIS